MEQVVVLEHERVGNAHHLAEHLFGRIGDANPDVHMGFSTTLRWKGLSIFGLLDMQVGGDVYNRTKQRMYQYFRSADADQSGRAEDVKKTTAYYTALYSSNLINSRFVEPAGYVKLREGTFHGSLPRS